MGIKACLIEHEGKQYFPIGAVSALVGKSVQMIRLWDNWSDDLEANGSKRLIPKSCRIGKTKSRCWTLNEINEIIAFSSNIKYGEMAEYSRTRWGEYANKLKQDKSINARKEKDKYRKNVDKKGKQYQLKNRADEIKRAKGRLIKAVRLRAKKIIGEVDYKD